MADGFARGHSQATAARRLASVRAFFDFLVREEGLGGQPGAAGRHPPKIPKKLPAVLSTEDANRLIDGIVLPRGPRPLSQQDRPRQIDFRASLRRRPARERAGRAQYRRYRPPGPLAAGFAAKAARSGKSLTARTPPRRWNVTCGSASGCRRRGKPPRCCCCTSGAARGGGSRCGRSAASVKKYALALNGDPSLHPHSLRHAFATHLLSEGADLARDPRSFSANANLSTTQRYTRLSLQKLMEVYDAAHPKA